MTLLSSVAVSCVEPVEFDTGHGAPMVVHCVLTESDVQELDLRLATAYGKNDGKLPEGITIELQDYRRNTICSFRREDEARWTADMRPVYGEIYNLSVQVRGKEIIRATTAFPHNILVKQFMKRRKGPVMENLYYSCELRIPYVDEMGSRLMEGAAYDWSANLWVFPKYGNLIATTHPYADDFNLVTTTVGDLPCFSRDSMLLWNTFMNEDKRWMKDVYQGLRMHDKFVRINFPPMFDNGEDPATISESPLYTTRSFILLSNYPVLLVPYRGNRYDIWIVSDELDLYLKDVYQKNMNRGRDMRLIYDHENTYSNVKGGMGIFGAAINRTEEQAQRGYNGDFFPE